jgi:putative pyruvate formate lyase activating enzyme
MSKRLTWLSLVMLLSGFVSACDNKKKDDASDDDAERQTIVTGTPFAPHIVEAVFLARQEGLALPIVWNTSGFETGKTVDLLNGTVDIYLTDIKYADDDTAKALSDAPDYFAVATRAARRMLDQVGPLQTDEKGIGKRGVIIRHLVLPNNLSRTDRVMATIADHFGDQVHVSLMGQYFPAHRASSVAEVDRPLTELEHTRARLAVRNAKITKGWFQEMDDPFSKRGA